MVSQASLARMEEDFLKDGMPMTMLVVRKTESLGSEDDDEMLLTRTEASFRFGSNACST